MLYIINNVFDVWPLLTKHQLIGYNLLKKSLLSNEKEFVSIESYKNFISSIVYELDIELTYNFNVERVDKSLEIPGIDSWIVGFINGEGSFPIKDRRIFTVEHTHMYALNTIKKRLCFEPKIRVRSPRERNINKIIKTTYILEICSKKNINTLIEFLDSGHTANLQGNKNIQYNKWKSRN